MRIELTVKEARQEIRCFTTCHGAHRRVIGPMTGEWRSQLPMTRWRRSQAVFELLLELLTGIVQAAHDRTLGALHHTADFVVRETLNFAQQYDGFVIRGQLVNGAIDALAD